MKVRKEGGSKIFMAETIALAREHMEAKDGGPFAALIVKDGMIIARGWNQVTSQNDPTAHAEIACIREACRHLQRFELSDCELFVNCEPCPMCLAAAYWARIKKITYGADSSVATAIGFDDALIYSELQKHPQKRAISMVSLMHDEATAGLQRWEKLEDKVLY